MGGHSSGESPDLSVKLITAALICLILGLLYVLVGVAFTAGSIWIGVLQGRSLRARLQIRRQRRGRA